MAERLNNGIIQSEGEYPEMSLSRPTVVKATGEVFVDITTFAVGDYPRLIGCLIQVKGEWRPASMESLEGRENGRWVLERYGYGIYEHAAEKARYIFGDQITPQESF